MPCFDRTLAPETIAEESRHSPGFPDQHTNANDVIFADDDQALRHSVINYLENHNFWVRSVSSETELKRELARQLPTLVILDMWFQHSGFSLLRGIRLRSNVPAIALTHRPDVIDRISSLEFGADDCLVKPFGLRELLARVRALLRRTKNRTPKLVAYRFNGWEFERGTRRLVHVSGPLVPLTRHEYALLLAFLESPQQPLKREQLLEACRVHEDVSDRSIDAGVMRLRRKLEGGSCAPPIIRTLRGFGYMFVPPVKPVAPEIRLTALPPCSS